VLSSSRFQLDYKYTLPDHLRPGTWRPRARTDMSGLYDPEATAISAKTEELNQKPKEERKKTNEELARKEAEQAELARKEAEMAELARKEAEMAELFRKEAEESVKKAKLARKEAEQAELARKEAEKAELARKEAEQTELARKEAEESAEKAELARKVARKAAEMVELFRKGAEKAELARKEAEQAELARKQAEMVEIFRKEAEESAEKAELARKEAEQAELTRPCTCAKALAKLKLTNQLSEAEYTQATRLLTEEEKNCHKCENGVVPRKKTKEAELARKETEAAQLHVLKEYTFTERPFGLVIKGADKMVIAAKVRNQECLRQGIVDGSQLLSVGDIRLTNANAGAVRQYIKTAQLPLKLSFKCPTTLAQEAKEEVSRREAAKSELTLPKAEINAEELAEKNHREAEEKKSEQIGSKEAELARRNTKAEELAREKAELAGESVFKKWKFLPRFAAKKSKEKESEKIEAAEDKPKVQKIQVRKIKGVWKWVDTGAPRPIRVISKIVSNRGSIIDRFVHYHNDEIISTYPAQIEIDFKNEWDNEVGYYLRINGLGHSAKVLEDFIKNPFLSIARRQSRSRFGNIITIGGIGLLQN